MQLTRRSLLAVGLLSCLVVGETTAAVPAQPFLPKDQLAALAQARSAIISDIGWMRRTPKMIDQSDWDRSSKPLSPQDAAAMRGWIAEASSLDQAPKPAQCHFAPGFQIRFLNEKRETLETLLICLNCNVLAVGDAQANGPGAVNRHRVEVVPARYGDAAARREDTRALVARYFPIR